MYSGYSVTTFFSVFNCCFYVRGSFAFRFVGGGQLKNTFNYGRTKTPAADFQIFHNKDLIAAAKHKTRIARGPYIGVKLCKSNTEIIVNTVTFVHLIKAMFAVYKITFAPARNS